MRYFICAAIEYSPMKNLDVLIVCATCYMYIVEEAIVTSY